MHEDLPPTIDPIAAARWAQAAPARSPWLHEEVGRRMADRLQWIRLSPAMWVDWQPVRGGVQAHRLVQARYPQSSCVVIEATPRRAAWSAAERDARPWWRRMLAGRDGEASVEDGSAQMLWANMALHMAANPRALIERWHRLLAVDGFLMFSCFGPDTLRELRALYAALGWPPPAHEFTDMHDWGDMLVHSGFAEPVMDMERVTLTWESPQRLIAELRELGANLHPARFAALRGRRWRDRLHEELSRRLAGDDGRLALTFEIIYGHAIRPPPRVRVENASSVTLADMKTMLRSGRDTGKR